MNEFPPEAGSIVYSPSELNAEIRLHLEAGFPRVLVEGEISNLSRPSSGHLYFSLKDEAAQVRCAMFRTAVQRCSLRPDNGLKVRARGRISLYEARGEYQLIVDALIAAGEGLLQQRFEALKRKLASEGLFAPERKRTLPAHPLRIGVVTSASGAAVRDILHVLQRRWPVAAVRLYATAVQGLEAPGQICAALARANGEAWAQVLIVGRGGGSLEDLQAFNEESVARAVAASGIPTISAVGHETDFSITDFVADLRAPTPSAAAELATPDGALLREALLRVQRTLKQRTFDRLQARMQSLDYLSHRLSRCDPARRLLDQMHRLAGLKTGLERAARRRLAEIDARVTLCGQRLHRQHPRLGLQQSSQRLDERRIAAKRALHRKLDISRQRVAELGRTLHAVSPLATMDRGYSILQDAAGSVVNSVRHIESGQHLSAQLRDGRLACRVEEIVAGTLPPASPPDRA